MRILSPNQKPNKNHTKLEFIMHRYAERKKRKLTKIQEEKKKKKTKLKAGSWLGNYLVGTPAAKLRNKLLQLGNKIANLIVTDPRNT